MEGKVQRSKGDRNSGCDSARGELSGSYLHRVTVLHNAVIVTVDPEFRVFRNGALVVEDDVIRSIGQSALILHDHSHIADELVDIGGRFILPGDRRFRMFFYFLRICCQLVWLHDCILLLYSAVGFINTHVHTSQQLARGIADDVDLMTWLHKRIWPYESNMTEEDSYLSTLLCGIELIHSGVSTTSLALHIT